jgi:hypothetical protein
MLERVAFTCGRPPPLRHFSSVVLPPPHVTSLGPCCFPIVQQAERVHSAQVLEVDRARLMMGRGMHGEALPLLRAQVCWRTLLSFITITLILLTPVTLTLLTPVTLTLLTVHRPSKQGVGFVCLFAGLVDVCMCMHGTRDAGIVR